MASDEALNNVSDIEHEITNLMLKVRKLANKENNLEVKGSLNWAVLALDSARNSAYDAWRKLNNV